MALSLMHLSSAHHLHDRIPKPQCFKFDVFFSFQGEGSNGTRNNFADVLYAALSKRGVTTFKDDEELKKGRVIGDDLMKAIEDSELFLIVFSRDYASSNWCLEELSKIMECSRIRGISSSSLPSKTIVLPVFHDVEPKDVRTQKGSFEESFLRHEQDDAIDKQKISKWKSAMRDAGNLSGWVTHGKKWTEIVDEIAQLIFDKTNHRRSSLSKELVGFDLHLQNITTYLTMDSISFIGICGMGGIGKTALASVVHRQIHHHFEASIFLRNIRETSSKVDGLVSLQKQLILKLFTIKSASLEKESDWVELIQKKLPQKRVLITLDDVDDSKQLVELGLSHDYFKNGSKVIITTRDGRLLSVHGAITYNLEVLNEADALKLFCQKAFHSDLPPEGYVELSNHFLNHAKGLPLALEVLGSSLYKRSESEWQSELNNLAKMPKQEVTSTLRISYDGLDNIAKRVFLHIACFFNGKSKHRVLFILSSCYDFSLVHIISLLKERSLIKESSDEKLWMHDLIQEMGREVVYHESPDHPGKRSLLWHLEDIHSVLKDNTGTNLIKGMVLTSPISPFKPLSARAFSKMTKLRLLRLLEVSLCDNLTYLSNELRFLKWQGFPFEFLPTSFEPENLVELKLPYSHLKELWRGTKNFMHLKTIKLSHSRSLLKTPNFTGAPHIEKIILEGCLQLRKVDESIGILHKLTFLCLKDCKQLKVLPDSICNLSSLKFLDLSGCSCLLAFPRNLDSLKCLEELIVDGLPMKRSSPSWFSFLALKSSRNLRGLCVPPLLGFTALRELDFSNCNLSDGAIADEISHLHSLEELSLVGNMFTELPPFFTRLTKLKRIFLMECKSLQYLPTLPSGVEDVYVDDCPSLESSPDQLFVSHRTLSFANCRNLARNYGGSSELAKMLLENYLGSIRHQATIDTYHRFQVCIPGNSIPWWISNKSNGCVVSIDLPDSGLQDTCNGFVVCCIVTLHKNDEDFSCICGCKSSEYYFHHIMCKCETDDGYKSHFHGRHFGRFRKNCLEPESDNLWLSYVSRKGFFSQSPLNRKRITFSFEDSGGVTIKSCGADLTWDERVRPMHACRISQLD